MADENPSSRNLDLNLGPLDNSSYDSAPGSGSYPYVSMNLEDWLDGPVHRVRDVVRQRSQRWRSLWRQVPIPPETRNLALELSGVIDHQTVEGSVAAEERTIGFAKVSETGIGCLEDGGLGKKEGCGKIDGDDGSFFDCNICLDLAKDPVVTCCGHLFCWPCLYQWLHHHSDAKECPVCKGEVTVKNLTPIYGRGNSIRETSVDSSLKIPLRPQARRVESWRQAIQRTAFTIPMEEMIRRLGSTFDLSREFSQVQPQNIDGPHGSPERSNSLLNRILTSRGMRRERTPAPVLPSEDIIDTRESSPTDYEVRHSPRLSSFLLRRSSSHPAAALLNLSSVINSAESLAAERDSLSSIAAVIHSESQTVDNAIEIDSTVSLSTLSSRRRNNASGISDMDTGDSRAPRRRRLN